MPLGFTVSVPIGLLAASLMIVGVPKGKLSGLPSPSMSTVTEVTVSTSPSGSVSLVSKLPLIGVSSATGTLSSIATGASGVGVTITLAVAGAEVAPRLSVTTNEILTAPLKLGAGVN